MRKILIQVTADDIRDGKRKSCKYCPVALAIRRTVGPNVAVLAPDRVGTQYVGLIGSFLVRLPSRVQEFITLFDGGKKVKPFKFFIQVP